MRFNPQACAAISLMVVVCCASAALAERQEPIDRLIARADGGGEKQAELYVEVARRYADEAGMLFDSGDPDKAQAAIKNVVAYADKARASVPHSEKRIKDTELTMRKLQRKLEDMAHAIDFDDRQPVSDAATHVQELRSELLDLMFRKDKK